MISETRTSVRDGIKRVLKEESATTMLQRIVELLHESFEHYSWVGLYWVENAELVLKAYSGSAPTTHTRIPLGTGICGAAAESGNTVIVPDVSKDPRYLMCFRDTKSEIVVPMILRDRVLGEIDIDSNYSDAFTQEDQDFLESIAALLGAELSRR